jgi:hypothetical protein
MAAPKGSAPLFLPRSVVASESAAVRIAGRASTIASVTPLERSFSLVGRMVRFANRVADGWLGASSEARPSRRAQVGAEVGLVVPRPWYLEPKPQAAAVPRRRPVSVPEEEVAGEARSSSVVETDVAPSTSTRLVPELPRDLVAAAPTARRLDDAVDGAEVRVRELVPRPSLPAVARRPESVTTQLAPLQAALRHAAWVDAQITQRVQAAATAVSTATTRAAERAATVEQALSSVVVPPLARPPVASARRESREATNARVVSVDRGVIDVETPSATPSLVVPEWRAPVAPARQAGQTSTAAVGATAFASSTSVSAPAAVAASREQAEALRAGLLGQPSSIAPATGFAAALPAIAPTISTLVDDRVQQMARFVERLVLPQLAEIATPRAVVLTPEGRPVAVRREAPEMSPVVVASAAPAARTTSAATGRWTSSRVIAGAAGAPESVERDGGAPHFAAAQPMGISAPARDEAVARVDATRPALTMPATSSVPSTVSSQSFDFTSFVRGATVAPSLARPGALAARAEEVAIGQALRVARTWGEALTVASPIALRASTTVTLPTEGGADRPVVAASPIRPTTAGASPISSRPSPSASFIAAEPADMEGAVAHGGERSLSPPASSLPIASQASTAERSVVPTAAPGAPAQLARTATGGVTAISDFISRLVGVQLIQRTAPLPIAATPSTAPIAPVGAAARAPLAEELPSLAPPIAEPSTARGREVRTSLSASRALDARDTASEHTISTQAQGGAEAAPALRPGGVALLAEQLGGQVGVRASSLAIEFVDPAALPQLVSVSRAAEPRAIAGSADQVVIASPGPRALAAGGEPQPFVERSMTKGAADVAATPATASSAALGAIPSSAASRPVVAPAAAAAPGVIEQSLSSTALVRRIARKANTLAADEWALVSVFPSQTTAYQVAAARQARLWQRFEVRGVDAVFSAEDSGAPALSFAPSSVAAPTPEASELAPAVRGVRPIGMASVLGAEQGDDTVSPYVVSWMNGGRSPVVAPTDQPRLPDGHLPRGGALWPSAAKFEPTLPSLTSSAERVAATPPGQPLWNSLPSTPHVRGVALPVAGDAPGQEDGEPSMSFGEPSMSFVAPSVPSTRLVPEAPREEPASIASRVPSVPSTRLVPEAPREEPASIASRVPSAPLVRTVAPASTRPTVRPLSRAEREDGDVRPAPGSPEARPALALLKGGAGGSAAARSAAAGYSSTGVSGSPAAGLSTSDGGSIDPSTGASFRPSSDAAAKLLEALRQPGAAIPQDGRVTMADLTLIAIASTTQQVAAAEEGGGPAAASGGGGGGGGAGAAPGGGKAGGGAAPDIIAIAEKVLDAYKRLLEIQRERSGDSWES